MMQLGLLLLQAISSVRVSDPPQMSGRFLCLATRTTSRDFYDAATGLYIDNQRLLTGSRMTGPD